MTMGCPSHQPGAHGQPWPACRLVARVLSEAREAGPRCLCSRAPFTFCRPGAGGGPQPERPPCPTGAARAALSAHPASALTPLGPSAPQSLVQEGQPECLLLPKVCPRHRLNATPPGRLCPFSLPGADSPKDLLLRAPCPSSPLGPLTTNKSSPRLVVLWQEGEEQKAPG